MYWPRFDIWPGMPLTYAIELRRKVGQPKRRLRSRLMTSLDRLMDRRHEMNRPARKTRK